jgi:hypothetical protein
MALDLREKLMDVFLNFLSQDHLLGRVTFQEDVAVDG